MTAPNGSTPDGGIDSTGLADFANTTEAEWNSSITASTTLPWGGSGVFGALFSGLATGKPFVAALIEAILNEVFGAVTGTINTIAEALAWLGSLFTPKWTGIVAAQSTADSALAGLTLLRANTNSTGITLTDTFDRSAATSLGGQYYQTYSSGAGTLGTDGANDAQWVASGSSSRTCIARHITPLSGNTQAAAIVIESDFGVYSTGDQPQHHIWLRMDSTNADGIVAVIAGTTAEIYYVVGGVWTRFGAAVTGLGSAAGQWELQAGTHTSDYEFILYHDNAEILRRTDSGMLSAMDSNHWFAGLGMHSGVYVYFFSYIQGTPPKIQAFTAIDATLGS